MTASLPPGYAFTALDESRVRDVWNLDMWAFPSDKSLDDLAKLPFGLPWDRFVGVTAPGAVAGDLAAVHGSYAFTAFPVPGAELPMGGLTWVGVHPQHRRQGILSAMIDHHFALCVERGEALSGLFAAEEPIYPRFGYGRAADVARLEIPRRAELRDVPGAADHTVRVEHFDVERHADQVEELYVAAGRRAGGVDGLNRPGWASRETPELRAAYWDDNPSFRDGGESRRIVVVERDGVPRGYATLRRKSDWQEAGARGRTNVSEFVSLDAAAARALWGVLLDFDLTATTGAWTVPVDDPITHLLVDRRAAVPRLGDNLWLRVVDVAVALAGRQYATDVDVVLGVTDARLPSNTGSWHVRADAFAAATCVRTDAPADLELDVRDLGAAYLGGTSLASLAAAGLVTERTPGALARASVGFGWPVAPACGVMF